MKSGKPLVLVVNHSMNHSGTVQRRARRGVGQRSHLRLVAVEGAALARVAGVGGGCVAVDLQDATRARETEPSRPTPLAVVPTQRPVRPPRSFSRPFGQRIVQVANDVAVLALALISGLRPRA